MADAIAMRITMMVKDSYFPLQPPEEVKETCGKI